MRLELKLLTFILAPALSFGQIIWEPINEVASSDFGNNFPKVMMGKNDIPHLSWSESGKMYFAKWTGSSFSTPVQVNPDSLSVSGADWMGPEMAVFGDTLYFAFKESPVASANTQIYCVSSFDGGLSFNAPVRVSYVAPEWTQLPTITVDALGNPIIAFMEMNDQYLETKWMVARSNDAGQTFETEVLASGWSSATTEACDCCPGQIVSKDNTVAMLYRDNDDNIRDSWAGISTDGGATFTYGMNIDQLNWNINGCPSSAPDGFIVNDTLYAVYMSAATGASRIYFSKSSLSDQSAGTAQNLGVEVGNGSENFPRIDHFDGAAAVAFQRFNSGKFELVVHYGATIDACLDPEGPGEVLAEQHVSHPDIALGEFAVFVVWQDNSDGTLKYRKGNQGFLSVPNIGNKDSRSLVGVYDLLGRPAMVTPGETLIYLYSDGTREKKVVE